jgi:hypothetical protein
MWSYKYIYLRVYKQLKDLLRYLVVRRGVPPL